MGSQESGNGDVQASRALQPGWCEQAIRNQQPTGEAGMWSPENPTGTRMYGWNDTYEDLYSFAFFPPVLDTQNQVKAGLSSSKCTSPIKGSLSSNFRGDSHRLSKLSDCNSVLEVLMLMAQKEEWTVRSVDGASKPLGCLEAYLNSQFMRLIEQGKVVQCFDDEGVPVWACFCTGLLSRVGEEFIYVVLQRTTSTTMPWQFYAFASQRQLEDAKQPWNKIEPILNPPEKATFVDDPLDLIFMTISATGEPPQLNLQEIDGWDRFISNSPCLWETGGTIQTRKQAILAGVQRAVQIMQQNPLAGVPQFYRPNAWSPGVVQILLPLKLNPDSSEAQLALAVETSKSRRGARAYRASRLLTLDDAYINARVIMPVHQPWLASCRISHSAESTAEDSEHSDHHHHHPLAADVSLSPHHPSDDCSARNSYVGGILQQGGPGYCFSAGHDSPPPSFMSGGSLSSSSLPGSRAGLSPTDSLGMSAAAVARYGGASPPMAIGSYNDMERKLAQSRSAHDLSRSLTSNTTVHGPRLSPGPYSERKVGGKDACSPLPPPYSGTYATMSTTSADANNANLYERLDFFPTRAEDHSISPPHRKLEAEMHMAIEALHLNQLSQLPAQGPPFRDSRNHQQTLMSDMSCGPAVSWPGMPCPPPSTSHGSCGSAPGERGFLHWDEGGSALPSCGRSLPSVLESSTSRAGAYSPKGAPFPWEVLREPAPAPPSAPPDFERPKEDEYVAFTPEDDLCPKINISQLPPRFVLHYLQTDRPDKERIAEQYTEHVFHRYGTVARSLVRENKNHPGKWFAIVEFQSWTDDVIRLRLVAGEQIRFQNFYDDEDVFIKRHRDKQSKVFRSTAGGGGGSGSCSLPQGQGQGQGHVMGGPAHGGLQVRPHWNYTGMDTRAGKPLYKGPCTVCGRESTVPFKPVVNGQPPRCRNCLPVQGSSAAAGGGGGGGHDPRLDVGGGNGGSMTKGGGQQRPPSRNSGGGISGGGGGGWAGMDIVGTKLAGLSQEEILALASVVEGQLPGATQALRFEVASRLKGGFHHDHYSYLENQQQRHVIEMG